MLQFALWLLRWLWVRFNFIQLSGFVAASWVVAVGVAPQPTNFQYGPEPKLAEFLVTRVGEYTFLSPPPRGFSGRTHPGHIGPRPRLTRSRGVVFASGGI